MSSIPTIRAQADLLLQLEAGAHTLRIDAPGCELVVPWTDQAITVEAWAGSLEVVYRSAGLTLYASGDTHVSSMSGGTLVMSDRATAACITDVTASLTDCATVQWADHCTIRSIEDNARLEQATGCSIDLIEGDSRIGEVRQTHIHYMQGAAVLETASSSSIDVIDQHAMAGDLWDTQVDVITQSASVDRLCSASRVSEMKRSATVWRMSGTSSIGAMAGTSRVGRMDGYSTVERLGGKAEIREMYDYSRVLSHSPEAKIHSRATTTMVVQRDLAPGDDNIESMDPHGRFLPRPDGGVTAYLPVLPKGAYGTACQRINGGAPEPGAVVSHSEHMLCHCRGGGAPETCGGECTQQDCWGFMAYASPEDAQAAAEEDADPDTVRIATVRIAPNHCHWWGGRAVVRAHTARVITVTPTWVRGMPGSEAAEAPGE